MCSWTEYEHPGGGRAYPCHSVILPEARARDGGLRGGEGRGEMEADLRCRLDPAQQQSHLWHVWFPWGEEVQRQSLQVSMGGKEMVLIFYLFVYLFILFKETGTTYNKH